MLQCRRLISFEGKPWDLGHAKTVDERCVRAHHIDSKGARASRCSVFEEREAGLFRSQRGCAAIKPVAHPRQARVVVFWFC